MMRFFTREWATGELTDEEYDAAFPAYASALAALDLPSDAARLAETDLHDGILERLSSDDSRLSLSFITGDLQQGYFSTLIVYSGCVPSTQALEKLRAFVGQPRIELLYSEVDRDGESFMHRMLFSTYDDVEVRFTSVDTTQSGRADRSLTK